MKTKTALQAGVSAFLLVAGAHASAQSSNVEIYGNVDLGLTYVNNTGGDSNWTMNSGIGRPSRIGFRGNEDLGGGMRAMFVLETGLNVDTGTQADSTALFGREAAIGLQDKKTFGTIKLGRMPDFFFADLGVLDSVPLVQGGLTSGFIGYWRQAGSPGPIPAVSLHYPGARYNNSIKWLRDFGPVRAGLMYGMGAENDRDRMHSAMLRYEDGAFAIAAGYTKDNFTTALYARETLAIKAQYRDGKAFYFANYGIGKDTRNKAEIRPLEIGVQYALAPAWRVGGGIGYAWAKDAVGKKARIQQPFVGAKYLLSKRTELYAMAAYNRATDPDTVPSSVGAPGGAPVASTSSSQKIMRFGVLHYF